MGSRAQINQVTASVRSDTLAILDLGADGRHFEWVGLEEGQSLLFGQDEALERLV